MLLQTAWIMNKLKDGHSNKDRARSNSETLREFISTQDGFEQFMTYLQKEFSLELMLFVIETVQLKELMLTLSQNIHIPLNENADIESKYGDKTKVVLTANVPKSRMVHILFDESVSTQTLEARLNGFAEFHSEEFAEAMRQCIVSEMEMMDKFKVTAYLIYAKYIADGSRLQINISG